MKNISQTNPAEQSREDRFKRIASNRTNDILDRIRILGNCSNKSSYKYSEDEVKNILSHRGPDFSSVSVNKHFLFVHNRLSIIDLTDDANQPFISDDTGNVLLFNGEIYNYKELKKKYKDITWMTNSDTEVIIKLYDLKGPLFVNELNGIFSFVIYDKINNKLLLYRDRLGVKPLYYKKTYR